MVLSVQYVIFHLILAQKGFLTISLLTFRAKKFFLVRSYPVHRRMLSSIPAIYPLGASSTHTHPPVMTTRYVCKHYYMFPVRQNCPHLRITALSLELNADLNPFIHERWPWVFLPLNSFTRNIINIKCFQAILFVVNWPLIGECIWIRKIVSEL